MIDNHNIEALRAQRERCLDNAAIIAALFTAGSDAIDSLRLLSPRQEQLLDNHLHSFAFYVRRYMEHAIRAFPDLDSTQLPELPSVSEDAERENQNWRLRDVLGRIIHSVDLKPERIDEPHYADRHPLPPGVLWGFTVRSERDPEGKGHFFHMEFFLNAILEFDSMVAERMQGLE